MTPSETRDQDALTRFRAGFTPSLLIVGALTTCAATVIAHVVTRVITGHWWIGPMLEGPALWILTMAAALTPFWTAHALPSSRGVPARYWLQATF